MTDSNTLSGFLDGYMAGNLAANSNELKAHSSKIRDLMIEFENSISNMSDEKKKEVIEALKKFETKDYTYTDNSDLYFDYSMDFSELVSKINVSIERKKLPTESQYFLKRAIYHFLNIAKTLQDTRVIETAKKVALQFK